MTIYEFHIIMLVFCEKMWSSNIYILLPFVANLIKRNLAFGLSMPSLHFPGGQGIDLSVLAESFTVLQTVESSILVLASFCKIKYF